VIVFVNPLDILTTAGQQKFYLEHTDDILALTVSLNPKFPNIVASGQLDAFKPTIHLWDGKTLKNICILQANHDKVNYLLTLTQLCF